MKNSKDYVYKLPEDYFMEDDTRVKLDKLVADLGLTNKSAQEIIDLHVELTERYAARLHKYVQAILLRNSIIMVTLSAVVIALAFSL